MESSEEEDVVCSSDVVQGPLVMVKDVPLKSQPILTYGT